MAILINNHWVVDGVVYSEHIPDSQYPAKLYKLVWVNDFTVRAHYNNHGHYLWTLDRGLCLEYCKQRQSLKLAKMGVIFRETPVPYTGKYKCEPGSKKSFGLRRDVASNDYCREYKEFDLVRSKRALVSLDYFAFGYQGCRGNSGVRSWKRSKKRKQWM